jgi:hypothetical protein
MPRANADIVLDDDTVEIRKEEDVSNEENAEKHTKNDADSGARTELLKRRGVRCLNGDE